MTISDRYVCENGHTTEVSIRNEKIIFRNTIPAVESDIDDFIDVPAHIKTIVKEAYKCSAYDAPIAGASVVRRLLDELLYELGCTQPYLGAKVTQFESLCNSDQNFRQSHATLYRRLPLFRTIANLAGYHAHAQEKPIINVVKSEFEEYLHAVEGAIKDKWPNRRNR